MKTRVLRVGDGEVDPAVVAEAVAVWGRGGLVAFPTETVYGLGADALNPVAVRRIYDAKGRPSSNPLIVHVADADAAIHVAAAWPDSAARLAERFWPGPLTLVLPKRNVISDAITGGGPTVAVRVPGHPVALALLRTFNGPVVAPSANRSTELSPTTADHVLRGLDGRIDLVIDGGPTAGGIESTVIDLSKFAPRLLRPGLITVAELEAVVGSILSRESVATIGPAPSPGLGAKHYSPRTPLELVDGDGRERARQLLRVGERVGRLTWDGVGAIDGTATELLPRNPAGYAAGLFAALHRLDALNLTRILVSDPPDDGDWRAVRDRLTRAANQ